MREPMAKLKGYMGRRVWDHGGSKAWKKATAHRLIRRRLKVAA